MATTYINDSYLRLWKSNFPSLRELDVFNNQVTFQGETINLGSFNVQELLYNSTFSTELSLIDSKTLFDILKVCVDAHKINTTPKLQISSLAQSALSSLNQEFADETPFDWNDFYSSIHQNTPLNQETIKKQNDFYQFILRLLQIESYLTIEAKNNLDNYKLQIMTIETKEENELNSNEINAIAKFHDLNDRLRFLESNTGGKSFELKLLNPNAPKENIEEDTLNLNAGKINIAVILILISNIFIHLMFMFLLK